MTELGYSAQNQLGFGTSGFLCLSSVFDYYFFYEDGQQMSFTIMDDTKIALPPKQASKS
jgi:hypothetical protein